MKLFRLMLIVGSLTLFTWAIQSWGIIDPVAKGQSPDWSTPMIISNPDDEGVQWFPDIVADLTGGVHMFWTGGNDTGQFGYDTVNHCLITDGVCSDVAEIIAFGGSGSIVTRPAVALDNQNRIHLLSRNLKIFHTLAPAERAHQPTSWRKLKPISGISGYPAYSDVVLDSQQNLHVVWSEQVPPSDESETSQDPCPYCSDIFYRRSSDYGLTWTTPVDLTNSEMGAEKPHLVVDSDDNLFLFWEEGADFYSPNKSGEAVSSGLVSSFDNGDTWSTSTMFIFPNDAPQRVTAGIDNQNNLVVVWGLMNSEQVYYQISRDQGLSWSSPRSIPGVLANISGDMVDLDTYHMAGDSANHLHFVMAGKLPNSPPGTYSILHVEWNGSKWSEPRPIYNVTDGLPVWPRVAVANGNQIHIVWFVRRALQTPSTGESGRDYRYQVWHAQGRSSAPEIAPVVVPTPTATPTPAIVVMSTPTFTPTPLPTPTPTLDPLLSQLPAAADLTGTIYTDMDDILLLLKSLLPAAVGVVIVVIGIRKFRGRR